MTERGGSSGAATPDIQPARQPFWKRLSIVWLVPIAALLISIAIVAQSVSEQGRTIEIAFEDASGVRAEETELRYRDVVVGLVEEVTFTQGLDKVLVTIRLDQSVEDFVDVGAEFWVVSPRVTSQGISGLETVLSGVYIEGSWDGIVGETEDRFVGLDDTPLVQYGQEGLRFRLRSSTGEGLSRGIPILYRGIQVGQVGDPQLDQDGISVVADAFIRNPEARLITTATRFWDAAGFSLSFGAAGAELDVSSLASLVSGGILFDTFISGGEATEPGEVFRLFSGEDEARSSVFAESVGGPPIQLAVIFDDPVGGLEVGADVLFGGLAVGEVTSLTGLVDEARFGDQTVRLLVAIEIQPGRLGLGADANAEVTLDFLQFAVERGLRAQLQSAGLLGGVQIGLIQVDDAPPEELDLTTEPLPILPSLEANLSDFADTAQGVFSRVNALPIEEVLESALTVMANVNAILTDEGVVETPQEVLSLLGDVRAFVASDGVQDLPDQAADVMSTLQNSAREIDTLVRTIVEAGTAEALVDALEAAEEAADSVYEAMEEVPATLQEIDAAIASLDALIQDVDALPIDATVDRVNGILAGIEELVTAPATQALPADVKVTIERIQELLTEVRDEGLIAATTRTIEGAEIAVRDVAAALDPILEEARRASEAVARAADGAPELIERANKVAAGLEELVSEAAGLPLEDLARRATDLLETANTLLSSDDVARLPGALAGALEEVRRVLIEVQEGGLIENANSTLAAAEDAAVEIARASQQLPGIAQRLNSVLAEAEALITGYQANGALGSEARSTLRDIRAAAQSVDSLSRAIERNPNSLLFGR